MPLDYILDNKLIFYKAPYNLSDSTIDNWSFYLWQMNIEKINKMNNKTNEIDEDKMKDLLKIKK